MPGDINDVPGLNMCIDLYIFKKSAMTTTSSNHQSNGLTETGGLQIRGHIKISDPTTNQVLVDKPNAIHYEHFSIGLAQAMSNQGYGFISEMCFGNGGTHVDPTGIITYLTPNAVGSTADLYNLQYTKNIDSSSAMNLDPTRNFMEIRHISGTAYTDILVRCLLDYGEPSGQQAFDNSTNMKSDFVFDEIGLRGYSPDGKGMLLTHVIFHPVQKSLNRMILVEYTVRIQSLTTGR